MALEQLREFNMRPWRLELIAQANRILEKSEREEDITLTLRGLHYEFVGQDLYPDKWAVEVIENGKTSMVKNHIKNYDKLGVLMMEARYAGLVDWRHLKDITRELAGGSGGWDSPAEVVEQYADYFSMNLWEGQPYRVIVLVEKDAQEAVVAKACAVYGVEYFSQRGFPSATSAYELGRHIKRYVQNGIKVLVLQLADLDPSGWDMTRDMHGRLIEFLGRYAYGLQFKRVGLDIEQAHALNLIPNPAKVTDNKAKAFIELFGDYSYELDAVPTAEKIRWINDQVKPLIDFRQRAKMEAKQQRGRDLLRKVAERWDEVIEYLGLEDWDDE